MFHLRILVFSLVFISSQVRGAPFDQEEQEAAKFLKEHEAVLSRACFIEWDAEFNHAGDMNEITSKAKEAAAKEANEIRKKVQLGIMDKFPNWRKFKNQDIRYQVKLLLYKGPGNMSIADVEKMTKLQAEITKLRADAKICDFKDKSKCDLALDPEIKDKLQASMEENNLEAAEYYWTEAHNTIGKAVTPEKFQEFVKLSNEYAIANDYANTMASWLASFDDHSDDWTIEGFENELIKTLDDFMPYYKKLHAYLRMKLKKSRGDSLKLPENGYMPYHIFGDILSGDWSKLAKETMPYPDTKAANVDEALVKAGFTPIKIVQAAEEFFVGLNEDWKLPKSVWEKSIFEKPADEKRSLSCHPYAFDFCTKGDYRIHICIIVNEMYLKTAYHELGHIIYYKEYADQPIAFRNTANNGFDEAIGDSLSLSVTPKHLKCELKLDIEAYNNIECGDGKQPDMHPIDHNDINVLYTSALGKLPMVPFSLSVDLWRTKIFTGEISPKDYNNEWWKIRQERQGMVPSSPRPPDNLDGLLLFHTSANIPFIIYFTSYALQFQFYEAMCIAAGQYDPNDPAHKAPLHRCDFSNSKEAGKLLKEMLAQGASTDWKTQLQKMTGSREISLRPLIHYYQPLFDYIDKELKENNFPACFGEDCK